MIHTSPIADELTTQIADAYIALLRTDGCAVETRRNVIGLGEETEYIPGFSAVAVLKHHLFPQLGYEGEGREQSVGELATDAEQIVLFFQLEDSGL